SLRSHRRHSKPPAAAGEAPFLGCDGTHGCSLGSHLNSPGMEWMLQAVDEVDDAVSTLRLYAMGFSGLSVAGNLAAACALCAALLRAAG
ncbi:MAG TPA: hypothetical protein VNV13_13035, partial [Steroidobacteraceae bacterium]|nr:hypothetical protein [Steroidobacteraceae bacterium]